MVFALLGAGWKQAVAALFFAYFSFHLIKSNWARLYTPLNYAFWLAVVSLSRALYFIIFNLVPSSLLEAEFIKNFENDCKIKVTTTYNNIDVVIGKYDKDKYRCEIVVHNRNLFKRIINDDMIAIGEGYMEGWYDCEHIDDLMGALADAHHTLPVIFQFIVYARQRLAMAVNNQTREKSVEVVETHYNLGNDLYESMLDPSMNYSCAYWKKYTKTLAEAQQNKMDLIARKLNLKPGMKILELGCGFGPMAKYLAEHYGVSVTCYNLSTEQVEYAKKSCQGLDVTFIVEDYRNATGQYDRIYSVGFFEHLGSNNFREYFELVHRCLKDDGLTLVHTITCNKSHPGSVRDPRWITKYIFPGGELPWTSDLINYCEDLFTVEDVQNLGRSYQKTLYAWHKNFNDNWDKLKKSYAHQQDGKFFRMWNCYLMISAGGFGCRGITLHQVVFSKPGRKEDYEPAR